MAIGPESFLLALLGGGYSHWYAWVFGLFAAAIVYPDSVVEWMSNRAGRVLDARLIFLVEAIALAGVTLFTLAMVSVNPRVHWWIPFLFVAVAVLVRALVWAADIFFGFRR